MNLYGGRDLSLVMLSTFMVGVKSGFLALVVIVFPEAFKPTTTRSWKRSLPFC
jgi:hypothetical protein